MRTSHCSRLKNRLYRLLPREDYHVNITRTTYQYAYARQTQVNRTKTKHRKEEKGKERKKKNIKEQKRKGRKRQDKQRKQRKEKEKGKKRHTSRPWELPKDGVWLIEGIKCSNGTGRRTQQGEEVRAALR